MENQNLSGRIKNFRIQKGFSQEALAEHSGLSIRTIQRMENNDGMPNADSLKKVTEALGISIEELSKNTKSISDLQYLKALNLSALSSIVFIFMWRNPNPIILILSCFIPVIMWVWKKDQISGIDLISKTIINTQLTWAMISFALPILIKKAIIPIILLPIMKFLNFGISSLNFNLNFFWGLIILINIILILINTFRIHSRKKLRSIVKINFIR